MFALSFTFPAGRYHATPWGRHVNEADVAWPPEPWRILRALIATWWRKGDREGWPHDDLAALIDALAETAPIYRLPEQAIHAHTRHYMPAPVKTTLIFDAFARIAANEELVVAWPALTLPERLFALAADLAEGIGYLGRAESWVECRALPHWEGDPNCRPADAAGADGDPVCLIAALAPTRYSAERARILADFDERERRRLQSSGKAASPKALDKDVAKARAKAFGTPSLDGAPRTLPQRLVDALTLDTADYQRFRWNRPPASCDVVYCRKSLSPTPRHRSTTRSVRAARLPTVARFVLAGRPRPRVEDAVKIGELMRLAALAKFDWETDSNTGRKRPKAPSVISGRGPDGRPLRNGSHSHAFWLPEDADDDGEIDHVTIYAEAGFDSDVRRRLDRLTKLWIEPGGIRATGQDDADIADSGRQEWRLALEGFGRPEDFRVAGRGLFGRAAVWESVTPFLASGHLKSSGYAGEVRRLLARRAIGGSEAAETGVELLSSIPVHGRPRRPIHFHRFRSRGAEQQTDTIGTFLKLTFPETVDGPLALGYGAHFGLGLFRAVG